MKFKMDHDVILDMWEAGESTDAIAAAVGTLTNNSILGIVSRHRQKGDRRAVIRGNTGRTATKERLSAIMTQVRRRRWLQKFPASAADLDRAIASFSGPITHLPCGVHAGHVPQCLKALNY